MINKLSKETALILSYDWDLWARDKQRLQSGDWIYWMIKAGRGFGKTRTGAETIRIWKENNPIILIAGSTAGDVRDIMIEGESGILRISPPWDRPVYEPSKQRLTWNNGSTVILRSADEPNRFRGLQCHKAWADELASWRYPEAWDQLKFGLRLGNNPQCIVTTTPRPSKVIKNLINDKKTLVTNGTTYENRFNLAPAFFDQIIKQYEGTRLGRQELMAEILEDVEGALWTSEMIEKNRIKIKPDDLLRIVVAVDPSGSSNKNSDEAGIIVAALGADGFGYVLEDMSGILSPQQWAERAIYLFHKWEADRIVAEKNFGGDMVETVIRNIDKKISFKPVSASRGKTIRAEPIVSLYEQNKIKHIGIFPKLEDEMCNWVLGDRSPNRIDALVWAFTELFFNKQQRPYQRAL